MLFTRLLGLTSFMCLAVGLSHPAWAKSFTSHQNYVLGTSFDLTVHAPNEAEAEKVKTAILAEIERLNALLSTYSDETELSRLNRSDTLTVSLETIEVLQTCDLFQKQTRNAISCRIGKIIDTWTEAETSNTEPSRPDLRVLSGSLRRANVEYDNDQYTVKRPPNVEFNVNAMAKGYIIDKALEAGKLVSPNVESILINIGGDVKGWQKSPDTPWTIGVSFPAADISTDIKIPSGAVATSGNGARDMKIGEDNYSHIISPRDGWPVRDIVGVSVYAEDAVQADALATALMIMPLKVGLNFVNDLDNTEALILSSDGVLHRSEGWKALETGGNISSMQGSALPNGYHFKTDFVIPKKTVSDYEQPYISAWIADKDRNLIKVLLLAGEVSRWQEENYYWHRRFGRKAGSLVDALSEPTRPPGQYTLLWDGRDDQGEPVEPGSYIFHIEASREHGGHQHDKIDIELGDQTWAQTMPEGDELGLVQVSYGP